LCKLRTI
jgi:hypothetical protein